MTTELRLILERIVDQCPPSMLVPQNKGYFLKDIVLSVADIQVLDKALKDDKAKREYCAI